MLGILILIVGISCRMMIHIPNFTPVIALALFSGVYLNKRYAVFLPLVLMMVSDIVIGFHDTILFTWSSVLLIAGMGMILRERKSMANIVGFSFASSILFFIITNFGAWLSLYPKTLSGLMACYTAAIPFYRSSLISTLLYSAVFFGGYEWVAFKIRHTHLAKHLLVS